MMRVHRIAFIAAPLTLLLAGCGDDPVSRPDATGACCEQDATCTIRTEQECTALNGSYQGNDHICDPNPCAALPGACCLPGGGCELRDRVACESDDGTFAGIAIPCGSVSCLAEPAGFLPPVVPAFDGLGDSEVQAFVSKHVQSTRVLLDYAGVLPEEPRWRSIGRPAPCWEHADTTGACVTKYDVCREESWYDWNGSYVGVCNDQPASTVRFFRATTSFSFREATLEFLDPKDGDVTVTLEWKRVTKSGRMVYTLHNGQIDGIVLARLELSPNDNDRQVVWEVPMSILWRATIEPEDADSARNMPRLWRVGPGGFRFYIWRKAEGYRLQTNIVWDGTGHGRVTTYDSDGDVASDREW